MHGNSGNYRHHHRNVYHTMTLTDALFLQDGTPSAAFAVVGVIGLLSVLGLWDWFAARKRRQK